MPTVWSTSVLEDALEAMRLFQHTARVLSDPPCVEIPEVSSSVYSTGLDVDLNTASPLLLLTKFCYDSASPPMR